MSAKVCQLAPAFTATAVMPDGSLKPDFSLNDYRGNMSCCFSILWTLHLFVHPKLSRMIKEYRCLMKGMLR